MNNNGSYALVFGVSVFDICGFTDNDYELMTQTQVELELHLGEFAEI